MPTISYRKLDPNGEPLQGNGLNNFVYDIDAVAQAILTRLRFLQGEWWENLNAGLPLFQKILGVGGAGKHPALVVAILKHNILRAPYVLSIYNVQTLNNSAGRAFSFSCYVSTQFGVLVVTVPLP